MFKKILLGLCLAMGAYATAPVTTSGVNYTTPVLVYTWPTDTIAATEVDTIASGIRREDGEEIVLSRGTITGGGSDSVSIALTAQATTSTGTIIYSTAVDTFAAAAGEAVAIPVMFGEEVRLILTGLAANGGVVIVNNLKLYKRKVLTITKEQK